MQALGLVWDNFDPLTADLTETLTEIPSPVHFGARLLFAHWDGLQRDGGLVVGRDLPARQLGGILRNLGVFEPIDAAGDFRVRLAGTAYLRRFGRDVTGLKLSEIFRQKSFETHRDTMARIVRSGVPAAFDVKLKRGARIFLHFESLRLPVFSPDRSGRWILSGLFYHD